MVFTCVRHTPDSKVHGANMGPTWVLSAPDGPHVGPMNLAIWDIIYISWLVTRALPYKMHEFMLKIIRYTVRLCWWKVYIGSGNGWVLSDTKPLDDDVIKWKHFLLNWPFVRGIHRLPVNSPHKGQWREALMFSLICIWTNSWVNNRYVGNLRCHRAHYDVTVIK